MEVCENADVESFLLAFERFISLRCKPTDVYCDLGSTNVAASKELSELLKREAVTIRNKMFQKGVNFHFNPQATPHWGGSYERAIRTARKCMKPALESIKGLTHEVLSTVVATCTRIINERPIAWGQDGLPLTPHEAIQPYSRDRKYPLTVSTYKHYKKVQQAEVAFWTKWRSLYLSQLSAKTAWQSGREVRLAVGDVVLVKAYSSDCFSEKWVLAKILEVKVNPVDNRVRIAKVKVPSSGVEMEVSLGRISLLEAVNYNSSQ